MIVHSAQQGSPEWLQLRAGKLTASCASDAFAKLKDGKTWAASRRNLILSLCLERLTGKPQGSDFVSPAMARGTELEPDARRAYESETGEIIEQVGFIAHDTLAAGGSPDGLIQHDGVLELKCPGASAHLDYVRGAVPASYRYQVQHLLWLTGREWGDLVSFHPDFPGKLRLVRTRLTGFDMVAYDRDVRAFLEEVQTEYEALLTLSDPAGRLAAAVL